MVRRGAAIAAAGLALLTSGGTAQAASDNVTPKSCQDQGGVYQASHGTRTCEIPLAPVRSRFAFRVMGPANLAGEIYNAYFHVDRQPTTVVTTSRGVTTTSTTYTYTVVEDLCVISHLDFGMPIPEVHTSLSDCENRGLFDVTKIDPVDFAQAWQYV
jgi:hypothetical protein